MTDYSGISAINWSTLKLMSTSARMLAWRREHPSADKPSYRLGRAVHCAVLEPGEYLSRYAVEPECDRRTRAGRALRAQWLVSLAGGRAVARPDLGDGRTREGRERLAEWRASLSPDVAVYDGTEAVTSHEVLSRQESDIVDRAVASVRCHVPAMDVLSHGRAEEVLTWTDRETGLSCKGRVDWIRPDYVADLKTTRRESMREIAADFARYMYHGQLAYYTDGAIAAGLIPPDSCPRVIVVQTVEPYDVVSATLSGRDLDAGRRLYSRLLAEYDACEAAGWWPGLAPEHTELTLPAWADGESLEDL